MVPPVFKTGERRTAALAGSIPVRLRYTTYHAGQNIVWAYWMRTAFSLSSDPAVLRQALTGRLPVGGRLRR